MRQLKPLSYCGISVVVLGAAGFIGRWVARSLSEQGASLILVVRDAERAERIFSTYVIDGKVVEFDLKRIEELQKLIAKIRPSVCFNLAGYGVDRTECDEADAYRLNENLVQKLCEAIAEYRDNVWTGQQLVHTGSALEYGEIGGDLAEDSQPSPTTLYGKSKLAGTRAVTRCCLEYGIRGVTARLFTVYGPGEHEGRLTPALLDAARTGNSIRLTDGRQRRDFIYVSDVAEGLLRLGLSSTAPGEIVNLATGQLTSVRQFIEQAAKILSIPGKRLLFGELPTRLEEMSHSPVAIGRLIRLTGWSPSTSVAEGIRKVWELDQQG